MQSYRLIVGLLVLLSLLCLINCKPSTDKTEHNSTSEKSLLIAAAANLEPMFNELGQVFQTESGIKPTFCYGATGVAAQQLENGAPYDLFYAADVTTIDKFLAKGLLIPESRRIYARGKLVVWWPPDSTIIPTSLNDLIKPAFKRIAIANPEPAPYGRAAKETLLSLDLWSKLEPRIVYGENVSATYQYARTGNVELAFIPLSMTKPGEKFLLVDEKLHQPIDQAVAISKQSKNIELAKRFDDFLRSEKGRKILEQYGYIVP